MMLGIAGVAYYNILSGVLRGVGDSFSALVYLLVATVINIILDIFFVTSKYGVPVLLATSSPRSLPVSSACGNCAE